MTEDRLNQRGDRTPQTRRQAIATLALALAALGPIGTAQAQHRSLTVTIPGQPGTVQRTAAATVAWPSTPPPGGIDGGTDGGDGHAPGIDGE